MDFFNEYFVRPMIERTGYNSVNTTIYALVAVVTIYLIYRKFKEINIKFNKSFIINIIPFILMGSSMRVITDSVDSGRIATYDGPLFIKSIYSLLINSHIYDYGPLTASPGIYIVVGMFSVFMIYLANKKWRGFDFMKMRLLVLSIVFINLLLLLPLFVNWIFGVLILFLAGITTFVYYKYYNKSTVPLHFMVFFAQALDGFATFITLDVYNKITGHTYFEQHVFANALADLAGGSMLPFLIVKMFLGLAIVYALEEEKDNDLKGFIAMIAIIFGMAPGVRDLLRLMAAT